MIDLPKLAAKGRAFSGTRPWETEELDALLTLERERKISRLLAADYIRNGILTLEGYDAAVKAAFVPKTTANVIAEAEALLKDNKFATKEVPQKEKPVKKSGKKK